MNKLMKMSAKLGPKANKAILCLKKNAPIIAVVAGIGLSVAGMVTGVRAGFRIKDHIDEEAKTKSKDISEDDAPKKKHKVSSSTFRYAVKELALPVGLCFVGTVCTATSHSAMARRNSALTAAYVGLDQAFKSYISRVKAEVGEEKEKEIHYGKAEKVEVLDENSQPIEIDTYQFDSTWTPDQLTRWFSDSDLYSDEYFTYNLEFLKAKQCEFNLILQTRGYVFLNDVYKDLGLPATKVGSMLGWVNRDDSPSYIDFGIIRANRMNPNNPDQRYPDILLDFNVDGNILGLLEDI